MTAIDPAHVVADITEVFLQASTRPCRAVAADGSVWVMKLAGAGPGPFGLLTEFLALAIAAAFGAPVPGTRPLFLPDGFPWLVGTDEFDETLQRSFGWNLGIEFLENAEPLSAASALEAAPEVLARIAEADRFLQNVDRTPANPNLLRDAAGRIYAIDFDACLFLNRALSARPPSFEMPRGHFLGGLAKQNEVRPLTLDWKVLLETAPDSWIEATGRDSQALAQALVAYAQSWPA